MIKRRATVEYFDGVVIPAFGMSREEKLEVAKKIYFSGLTATDEYEEGKNMQALLMTFDEEGEETGYKFFKLYSKREIIEYMKDKNPEDYIVDVFAPRYMQYDESVMEDDELYIIDYLDKDIITLFLKEEYESTTPYYV